MSNPPFWMNRHHREANPDDSDDAGSESDDGIEAASVDAPDVDPRKFFIVSSLGGRVLDIRKGCPKPNTEVNMYDRHPDDEPNQLWYQDDDGVIRSVMNRYTLDTSSGRLRMQPPNPGDPERSWTIQGTRLVNTNTRQCLEVPKAKDQNNRRIEPATYEGGDHQNWHIDYINE